MSSGAVDYQSTEGIMERQILYSGTKIKKKKQRKAGGRGWGGGWVSEIRGKER